MNKIKLLYCIILSIFLVGCTANYNVNIKEDTVEETVEFDEKDSSKWNSRIFTYNDMTYRMSVDNEMAWPTNSIYQQAGNPYEPVKMDGIEYYEKELINNSTSLGIKYNYTFSFDDYNNSNAAKTCFKNFSFGNGKTIIDIYAKDATQCFYNRPLLDKININLTSEKYKVISHNADSIKDGKYTWEINSKNASKKEIKMTLTKDENYVENKNSIEKSSSFAIVVVIVIFIVIVGGIILYLYVKNKNSSKL